MKTYLPCLLVAIVFLTGCYPRQAFYVSPYNNNNDHYHSIPLKSDSVKAATYIGGSIYTGSANTHGTDAVTAFDLNISRSHQFGQFQAYYGGNFSLGSYKVATFDSTYIDPTVSPFIINSMAGNKFFGGGGLSGGINIVLPFGGGGEWRALGIEASTHKEFGNYLDFRNKLPDGAATLIIRNSFFTTYGIYSEILGKTDDGYYGFRLATGGVLESQYRNLNIQDNSDGRQLTYGYFSFTFNYTYQKWTGYLQTNFGTKSSGANFGLNYYLGKQKR